MILCLHGLARTPADWNPVRERLEAFGDVVAPQLPRDPARAVEVARSAMRPGSIIVGHSLGALLGLRLAGDRACGVRALVLTSCFFPPARNGRSVTASVKDYAQHRIALVKYLRENRGQTASDEGVGAALRSLARLALAPASFHRMNAGVTCPVLVVHAKDDHFVPYDYAVAATAHVPTWKLVLIEHGGHNVNREHPERWLESVTPWMENLG